MALTRLVNVPQTSDPENFQPYADSLLAVQLPRLIDEINAQVIGGGGGGGTTGGFLDSGYELYISNGYGANFNFIRRFSGVWSGFGADISYTDSALQGGSFRINTAGIYTITYTDSFNVSGTSAGITRVNESDSFNSSIGLYGLAQVVSPQYVIAAQTSGFANGAVSCSYVGFLSVGDIIRPQTGGAAFSGNQNFCHFSIARVH